MANVGAGHFQESLPGSDLHFVFTVIFLYHWPKLGRERKEVRGTIGLAPVDGGRHCASRMG